MWKQRGLGTLPAFALEETRLAAGAVVAAAFRGSTGSRSWTGRNLHDNFDNLREFFWSARLLQFAPLAGAVAVVRRSLPIAGLLATWFGTFLVIKGTTELSTVSSCSFFRLLMPGFPAYFLLVVSIVSARADGRRLPRRYSGEQPAPRSIQVGGRARPRARAPPALSSSRSPPHAGRRCPRHR